MASILNIETATNVCSVCLSKDAQPVAIRESHEQVAHSANLSRFIESLFHETDYSLSHLDAISVSKGPGSYTGLRIGVSMAKGLAYALDIPLIGISTLEHMTAGAIQITGRQDALYCPLIDARRMEVYTALFDKNINLVAQPTAGNFKEDLFYEQLSQPVVYFFGNGLKKNEGILQKYGNSKFLSDFTISSEHMSDLSEERFATKKIESIAYFSPMYLKNFIPSRNKRSS